MFKTSVREQLHVHNRQGRDDLVKTQFLILKHISKSIEKEFPDSPVLGLQTSLQSTGSMKSFIRELRSHKPHGEAKKEKRAQKGARNNLKAIDFLKKT